MAILINENKAGSHSNSDVIFRIVHYIARDNVSKSDEDLICTGADGAPFGNGYSETIESMKNVQRLNGINETGGVRIQHLIFSLTDKETSFFLSLGTDELRYIGYKCANIFGRDGFQVFYGWHYSPMKYLHLHLGISSINYISGNKFSSYYFMLHDQQIEMNRILIAVCRQHDVIPMESLLINGREMFIKAG